MENLIKTVTHYLYLSYKYHISIMCYRICTNYILFNLYNIYSKHKDIMTYYSYHIKYII